MQNKSYIFSLAVLFSFFVFSSASLFPVPAFAAQADADFYVTDGLVSATVTDGSKLYIGGRFNYVGPNTGHGAVLSANSGQADTSWPHVNGVVYTSISDGAGGWYIGGNFTEVGGIPRERLAHINADKTVDPDFNPGANAFVYSLTLSGSVLYVGGAFTLIDVTPRNYLAAINVTASTPGSYVTPWNPNPNVSVSAMALSGNLLYIGGNFTTVDGAGRQRLAAVDTTATQAGSYLTAWNPGADSWVRDLVLSGNTLYIAGEFFRIDATLQSYLAAVDVTATTPGAYLTAWRPALNSQVHDLILSGSTLYIGGAFGVVDGLSRFGLAALNTAGITPGSYVTIWNPSVSSYVNTMFLAGNILYIGGRFTRVDGVIRHRLAAINTAASATGDYLTAWNPGANQEVHTLQASAGLIFAGGEMTSAGGVTRFNLAAIDTVTGKATEWDPGTDQSGEIIDLVLAGDILYTGGKFTTVDSNLRNSLAAINITATTPGTYVTPWDPSVDGIVVSMALSADILYIGGWFTGVDNTTRNRLAAIDTTANATGNYLTAWNPDANSEVMSIGLSGDTLYVGGWFSVIDSVRRDYVAALDITATSSGSYVKPWNPSLDSPVTVFAPTDSRIYVGGAFNTVDSVPQRFLAALDPNATAAGNYLLPWDPKIVGAVKDLEPIGTTLYVGGSMNSVDGVSRHGLVALDTQATTSGNYLLDWDPGLYRAKNSSFVNVRSLTVAGTSLYAGGFFGGTSTNTHANLAAFHFSSPTTTASPAGGTYNSVQSIILTCSDVSDTGCTTFYTTDGSEPTTLSTVYSGPITISKKTTLKFFSRNGEGIGESPIHTENYSIKKGKGPKN